MRKNTVNTRRKEMKSLKEDFFDIVDNKKITPVFQPIISLTDGRIIGYEALSRIVNPMVIHDKAFRSGFTSEYLKQYGLELKNIVFEITEKSAVDDIRGFKDTISHYKSQGYHIAVDDAGSCYSGLNLICDIVPHYLKLDIQLIRDIHKDAIKYAMVKSMVEFANLVNIQLVAEGIECEEELITLLKLGVHNGQGYFIRKPDAELKSVEKDAFEIIKKYNPESVKFIF